MINQFFKINTQKYGENTRAQVFRGLALFIGLLIGGSLYGQTELNYQEVSAVIPGDSAIEQMPQYPNGLNGVYFFIAENVVYPKKAIRKNIQGQVVVSFVVNTDGSISNLKVLKSVHPLLDEEAVRVIKSMTLWKPGTIKGKAVRVRMSQPIMFKISG